VIAPDRLPPAVLEGLVETGRPIGKLLASSRIETFREIVGIGFEPAGECADHFGVDPASNLVFRTYRIHVQQRPVMRITEKFPTSWFALGGTL
jgi:chorismate-pyruvate lyase